MRLRFVSLLGLALVLAGCAGAAETGGTTTTSEVFVTTTSAAATTSVAIQTAEWGEAAPAPGTYHTAKFVPGFTFSIDEGWFPITPELPEIVDLIDMKKEGDAGLSFLNMSTRSPEETLELLRTTDSIELGEEAPTEVGGITGTMVEATADSLTKIADLSEGVQWALLVGYRYRIQVLEVGGQTVTIIIEGTDETYEPFVAEADLVVESVDWDT